MYVTLVEWYINVYILHIYSLLWNELCLLNVTVFGKNVFKEVVRIKMRS